MAGKKPPKKNQTRGRQYDSQQSEMDWRGTLVRDTRIVIEAAQRRLAFDTLRCETSVVAELAEMLVDMAEDLHCEIGLWAAYEQYNFEVFGTELPMTSRDTSVPLRAIHPDRFCHFLWVMYPLLIDDLILSPNHRDLRLMAAACSDFLSDACSRIPKTSVHNEFLRTPNTRGWDVKRKLVWLGTKSYLFRRMFMQYMADEGVALTDIPNTDDFICMQRTQWSGMAAIDVLARVLDISSNDIIDLTNWYERHAAYYRIITAGNAVLQARNLISDQRYTIRMDQENPFRDGMVVFGSLVPWRGEWYWSGQQSSYDETDRIDVAELKQEMKRKSSRIVCRYDLAYRELVIQQMAKVHADSLAYFGSDLVRFPDGLEMASAFEKELRHQWDSKPQEDVQEVIRQHELHDDRPTMNFPPELINHRNGIGVFLNPAEGKEMMTNFTFLVSALEQAEGSFSDDQELSVRGFLTSPAISPDFVKRVLSEYGDQAVRKVFVLDGEVPPYWLEYLLRRFKGKYFRRRYPGLSVI